MNSGNVAAPGASAASSVKNIPAARRMLRLMVRFIVFSSSFGSRLLNLRASIGKWWKVFHYSTPGRENFIPPRSPPGTAGPGELRVWQIPIHDFVAGRNQKQETRTLPIYGDMELRAEACERAELPGLLCCDLRRFSDPYTKRARVQDKVAHSDYFRTHRLWLIADHRPNRGRFRPFELKSLGLVP